MNPFVLTAGAAAQPWRLWTCHLVHFSWAHDLLNGAALVPPLWLAGRRLGAWACGWLLLAAPVLSLALLPFLAGGSYRGGSGLVCALWALVGCRLLEAPGSRRRGLLLLLLLGLKVARELAGGPGLLAVEGWRPLPAAHAQGALVGLGLALLLAALRMRAGRR